MRKEGQGAAVGINIESNANANVSDHCDSVGVTEIKEKSLKTREDMHPVKHFRPIIPLTSTANLWMSRRCIEGPVD